MTKLTSKQQAFVAAYLETGNASDAYRTAYDAAGMSPASINREASALLDHPKVAARITPRHGGNSAPALKGVGGATIAIEQWPIGDVKPYAKNPRTISQRAIDTVANSLKTFGFRQPIVVDAKGTIIAGHTRLLAATKLGLPTVPVHVASDLDAKRARAYRLADNQTFSEWMETLLDEELAALAIDGIDMQPFGFEGEPLDLGDGSGGEVGNPEKPQICCPACGHEFTPTPPKA